MDVAKRYFSVLMLLALASLALYAQTATPGGQPWQPRVVDGSGGTTLASAFDASCKDHRTVVITAAYAGKEPIPAGSCDHFVESLDLRQADSLTGRLNVKSFGATGDGKTDDTAAIKAAIAYSLTNTPDGKSASMIYFPAGTFLVKGELRITGQTTIAGDGQAVSTIREMDPTANLFTVTLNRKCATGTCQGSIMNIGLAGNGHLSRGTLIEIDGTDQYHIDHVLLFNHGGRGLQMNNSSERLDSHDLSITLVRWPIVIGRDANESYFYDTRVMYPAESADGWCYNINCVDGKYPTNGPIAPDPHAAVTVQSTVNVGFYGGSIKPLQFIGGFKVFGGEVTSLDHFYIEWGLDNPGVIVGGVGEWTTTTSPLDSTGLIVPVKSVEWMPQYFNTASDIQQFQSNTYYAIIPPDFLWGNKEASSLGSGISKGTYEIVGVTGFGGDGTMHIGDRSRGLRNSTARAWPAGAVVEAIGAGVAGFKLSNTHINEQDAFSALGAKGAGLTADCDNTGVKTCAEIIAGYVPDGRWVQQHGSPGGNETTSPVSLMLDNVHMFQGGPTVGLIAAHSRGYISVSGALTGPSDGETAEVPNATSIRGSTGGSSISLPTYANGHQPQFFIYDGNNGKLMSNDQGFFTQLAAIADLHGQYLNGRQYSNSFSIFDIPPTGKHPLNTFTLMGGPNTRDDQGLKYEHWTGGYWANLFSVTANANNSADMNVDGVITARGFKIGNGSMVTSLPTGGAAASASNGGSTLMGTTAAIGGAPLTAGKCATGSTTVNGATSTMAVTTSPAGSPGDGFVWQGFVSGSNQVTVKVCALAGGTPAAVPYDVRVIP
jgi:hypothetical protein